MKFVRKEVLAGRPMAGVWCNLGSSLTAEIAGRAGFDWILLDMEHGSGDLDATRQQLQAIEGTGAAPVVRIGWNDPLWFKRVLDLGASGVMTPWVQNADEARKAAAAMRYPPQGIRGVATSTRATAFGREFESYFAEANDNLLGVVQIETEEGVRNAESIAAVDGADVLFVGPMDLTTSLGIPRQFEHAKFLSAMAAIAAACRKHRKAAGTLLMGPDQLPRARQMGYTFLALGSDMGMVSRGMRESLAVLRGAGG